MIQYATEQSGPSPCIIACGRRFRRSPTMRTIFEYVITPEQFARAARRNHQRTVRAVPLASMARATWVVLWTALGSLFFYALDGSNGSYAAVMTPVIVLLALVMAALLLLLFVQYQSLRGLHRKNHHLAGVPCKLTIEKLGLRHSSPHRECMTLWSGWAGIEDADDFLFLLVDDYFYPLPASAFESKEEKADFVSYVREQIGMAKREPGAPPIVSPPSEITTSTPAGEDGIGILAFLRRASANAFRLAFFQESAPDHFPVTWW
jgi:hypothetical protein